MGTSASKLPQKDTPHPEEQLNSIITSSTNERFSADVEFEMIPANEKALILLAICQSSERSDELRSLSIDRLTSLLTDVVQRWGSEVLVPFNEELIKALLLESNDKIRDKLGDLLVQVALHSLYLHSGVHANPSICEFIINCMENECDPLKKTALSIVRRVPNLFGICRVSDLKSILNSSLNHSDVTVRLAAMQTYSAVVSKETMDALSPLLPSVVQICEDFLLVKDNEPSLPSLPSFCPIDCLFKLTSDYAPSFWPHVNAIFRLCGRVTPETELCLRERLTSILSLVLRKRENADIDEDSCSTIARFVLECAPATADRLKIRALLVVNNVPRAFDRPSTVLNLIRSRLDDDDYLVRIHALQALVKLLTAHQNTNYRSNLAAPLMPKIVELCEAQVEFEEEEYVDNFNPIKYLAEITEMDVKLISPQFFAVAVLVTNILRKTNTENVQPLAEPMRLKRDRALNILSRLFVYHEMKAHYEMTESENNMIAQLCQQLTKGVYCEANPQSGGEFLRAIRIVADSGGDADIDEQWIEVRRELEKVPLSEKSIKITLYIIRWVNVLYQHPSLAPSLFSLSFSHSLQTIRSLALEAFPVHCNRIEGYEGVRHEFFHQLSILVPRIITLGSEGTPASRLEAIHCFSRMMEGSGGTASILQCHIPALIEFYCKLIEDKSMAYDTRRWAVFSIANLCKWKIDESVTTKIVPDLKAILSSCLSLLSELNDDSTDWENRDGWDEGMEHVPIRERVETALPKLVTILKGRLIGPALLEITGRLLTNVDWKQRHAALIALSAIVNDCTEDSVQVALSRMISLLRDPHDRVRSAACSAINRFFTGCDPNLLDKSYAIVFPSLLSALEDTHVPRVMAAAAAALAACCKPTLHAHLSTLMNSAVDVLQSTYRSLLMGGKTRILSQLIALISCVRDVSSSYYTVNYIQLMEALKTILTAPTQCPMLDSISLECVSYISLAVGSAKCSEDCTEILHSLCARVDSLLLSSEVDLPSNLSRLATAMGDSFLPFLPSLMPAIIEAIQASNVDDQDNRAPVDQNGGIETRKRTACALATQLARALGAGFAPYASELSEMALAHLTMKIYNETEYWRVIRETMKEGRGRDLVPSIALCVEIRGRLTKDERKVIRQVLEKEKWDLRDRRESIEREKLFESDVEEEDHYAELRMGREKKDEELEEAIASLEINMKK